MTPGRAGGPHDARPSWRPSPPHDARPSWPTPSPRIAAELAALALAPGGRAGPDRGPAGGFRPRNAKNRLVSTGCGPFRVRSPPGGRIPSTIPMGCDVPGTSRERRNLANRAADPPARGNGAPGSRVLPASARTRRSTTSGVWPVQNFFATTSGVWPVQNFRRL